MPFLQLWMPFPWLWMPDLMLESAELWASIKVTRTHILSQSWHALSKGNPSSSHIWNINFNKEFQFSLETRRRGVKACTLGQNPDASNTKPVPQAGNSHWETCAGVPAALTVSPGLLISGGGSGCVA